MASWKLPFVVLAIAVAVVGASYLGGPGVGIGLGGLAAVAIVAFAVSQRPRGGIGAAPGTADARRLLVVVSCPVEDTEAVEQIVAAASPDGFGEAPEVLILAPARIGFLHRW